MLGKHYFPEGVLWLNQQWHDISKDTKIKPWEDGSESKFFPRKLLALHNPEEGKKITGGVLQLHQASQGETSPGVLTFFS